MNSIEKLTEYFSKFPGIGPRQAKRFVYFLLTRNNGFLNEFTGLIKQLKQDIKICRSCFRFYPASAAGGQYSADNSELCAICSNPNRDNDILMVVGKDADLENIERIGNYNGLYFVLGVYIPILEKTPEQFIRIEKFLTLIQKKAAGGELKEIILALSLNPEGENTIEYLLEKLKPLAEKYSIKISTLGRGLSTGTELEYSDSETFKNAFKNRN
ncbi:MAG: recombination protein RecR [Candidatus Pacebacteria bacterium]|nr:recombination protein RecR [Candidatus Paceibacterota bacterium]